MNAWPDLAIGVGAGAALVAVGIARSLAVRRVNRRYPDLKRRWCALDRRTRWRVAGAIRRGREVPREHAELVLELIEAADEVERERRLRLRVQLRRTATTLGGGLVLAALLIALGATNVGVVLASYLVAIALVIPFALVRQRRLPPRRRAARARIEELLARGP